MSDLPALPSADADFAHRRTRLHDHAVFDLGIAIVSGRLPEGVPFPEAEIGKMLGVSRTVVREATKVLAAKGLLRSRPRVGTVPLPRDSWDVLDPEVLGWMLEHGPIADVIRDVSEVRMIIEPAAARLAAMRRSAEEAERLRALADELVRWGDDIRALRRRRPRLPRRDPVSDEERHPRPTDRCHRGGAPSEPPADRPRPGWTAISDGRTRGGRRGDHRW